MIILLDIDDTALISNDKGKTYNEHPKLRKLLSEYSVVLYSGNPDIRLYYEKWGAAGFIAKGDDKIPEADVLIDNDAELWENLVRVKKCYKSIDSFLKSEERKEKQKKKS